MKICWEQTHHRKIQTTPHFFGRCFNSSLFCGFGFPRDFPGFFFSVFVPRQSGGSTLVLGHALGRRGSKKPVARFFSVDRDWGCMHGFMVRSGCGFENLFWVFPRIGVPQNGWFKMENPIKMDDLGGTTIFGNIRFWEKIALASGSVKTSSCWWCIYFIDVLYRKKQTSWMQRFLLFCQVDPEKWWVIIVILTRSEQVINNISISVVKHEALQVGFLNRIPFMEVDNSFAKRWRHLR